ncbi:MAG: hypothetical protein R3C68_02795 [Myxococcota bacterium]
MRYCFWTPGCLVLGQGRRWGLGDSFNRDSSVPVKALGLDHAISVAVGEQTLCAVEDDAVNCWGFFQNNFENVPVQDPESTHLQHQ